MESIKAIELMTEQEARLLALVNHRDCTNSFRAYIYEFLLNKEFYQVLADERSAEGFKSEPSELYKMFNDGNFGRVDYMHMFRYETKELALSDIELISKEFNVDFTDDGAWTDEL